MARYLAIYGTGGSGRELFEMIIDSSQLSRRWEELLFIDDTKNEGEFRGKPMMPFERFCNAYSSNDVEFSIAVGEPSARCMLAKKVEQAGYKLASVQHERARVSPSAQVGKGCVLKPDCIVSADAVLGPNTWLQSFAVIGHDAVVGENCQISNFVVVAGHACVGKNSYLGISSSIREGVSVGNDSIVSMGAMVQRDTKPGMVVMGNPAREIAKNTGVFE